VSSVLRGFLLTFVFITLPLSVSHGASEEAHKGVLGGAISHDSFCVEVGVSRLVLQGDETWEIYCDERRPEALPSDVRRLLAEVGSIHRAVARLLDAPFEAVFQAPVPIVLIERPLGSSQSRAGREGVELGVWPGEERTSFSASVYAHELMHFLAENPGSYREKFRGLERHPLLEEALPDWISSVVTARTPSLLAETGLPGCLREYRPVPRKSVASFSFHSAFSHFSFLAEMERISGCCSRVEENAFSKKYCESVKREEEAIRESFESQRLSGRIQAQALDDRSQREPFQAEDCRVEAGNGLVFFSRCGIRELGLPFSSFFRRLSSEGHLAEEAPLKTFLRALGAKSAQRYSCRYSASESAAAVEVVMKALEPAWVTWRTELGSNLRLGRVFDRLWEEHGLGQAVELDRLFMREALPGLAQSAVILGNQEYARINACDSLDSVGRRACAVECLRLVD
jgi:hypothetical protein